MRGMPTVPTIDTKAKRLPEPTWECWQRSPASPAPERKRHCRRGLLSGSPGPGPRLRGGPGRRRGGGDPRRRGVDANACRTWDDESAECGRVQGVHGRLFRRGNGRGIPLEDKRRDQE